MLVCLPTRMRNVERKEIRATAVVLALLSLSGFCIFGRAARQTAASVSFSNVVFGVLYVSDGKELLTFWDWRRNGVRCFAVLSLFFARFLGV